MSCLKRAVLTLLCTTPNLPNSSLGASLACWQRGAFAGIAQANGHWGLEATRKAQTCAFGASVLGYAPFFRILLVFE